jgi:hypothetical protein
LAASLEDGLGDKAPAMETAGTHKTAVPTMRSRTFLILRSSSRVEARPPRVSRTGAGSEADARNRSSVL